MNQYRIASTALYFKGPNVPAPGGSTPMPETPLAAALHRVQSFDLQPQPAPLAYLRKSGHGGVIAQYLLQRARR